MGDHENYNYPVRGRIIRCEKERMIHRVIITFMRFSVVAEFPDDNSFANFEE